MSPDTTSAQSPIDQRNRVFLGKRIPLFREGDTGPQIMSVEDANQIVNALNMWLGASLRRGASDQLSIEDGNLIIQLKQSVGLNAASTS